LRTLYWQSECSNSCKAWEGDSFYATFAVRQELQKVKHGIWDAEKGLKTEQPEDITTNTILRAAWYVRRTPIKIKFWVVVRPMLSYLLVMHYCHDVATARVTGGLP